MNFLRKLCKNVFLSAVSLFITLLLMELALRVFIYYRPAKASEIFLEPPRAVFGLDFYSSDGKVRLTPPHDGLGEWKYVWDPYLVYKNLPGQHAAMYNINSLGLRGKEVPRKKDPGVFRVVITGGSTAFGMGAWSDEATWTRQLEIKLNARGVFPGRVEVLNGAVIGYVSMQEVIALQLDLLDYSPDLVIALNGYNDFFNMAMKSDRCASPLAPADLNHAAMFLDLSQRLEEYSMAQDLPTASRIGRILVSIATRTCVGKFFYKRVSALKSSAPQAMFTPAPDRVFAASEEPGAGGPALNEECIATIAEGYTRNLKKMAAMLRRRKAFFIGALQPALGFKRVVAPEETNIQTYYKEEHGFSQIANRLYPEMARTAQAGLRGDPRADYFDTMDIFRDLPDAVFADEAHLNEHGQEVLAEFFANFICSQPKFFQR